MWVRVTADNSIYCEFLIFPSGFGTITIELAQSEYRIDFTIPTWSNQSISASITSFIANGPALALINSSYAFGSMFILVLLILIYWDQHFLGIRCYNYRKDFSDFSSILLVLLTLTC